MKGKVPHVDSKAIVLALLFALIFAFLIGGLYLENHTKKNKEIGIARGELILQSMYQLAVLPWSSSIDSRIGTILCEIDQFGEYHVIFPINSSSKAFGGEISGCGYILLLDISPVIEGDPWSEEPRIFFRKN